MPKWVVNEVSPYSSIELSKDSRRSNVTVSGDARKRTFRPLLPTVESGVEIWKLSTKSSSSVVSVVWGDAIVFGGVVIVGSFLICGGVTNEMPT